jgi:branched-chain amino acid transport system ATP-binding protein
MSKIRERLAELRPSSITGGAPFYPLAILFALNAVDELDRAAFNVLTPNIRDHFRLDIQGIFTVIALVGVAVLILQIPIAHFADRANRTRIATVGASVWAGFSVLTGLAPTILILGIARAGSGIGQAVNFPTHNSLLADYYDVSVRPKVYGFHRAANSIGQIVGPLAAGGLAYVFGWRTPFVLFGIPTLIFVLMSLQLKEPVRGAQERAVMGASAESIQIEESPPSFAEAYRLLFQVRTLRRIWYSLPFLASAFIGFGSLLSIYYEQVFGLDEAQRGIVFALSEPAQILGLLITVPIANRLMARDPGLGVRFLGISLVLTAVTWTVFIVSPVLAISVGGQIIVAGLFSVVGPGVLAALSLALPPKVRSLGFTLGGIFYLPGYILLVIIGALADAWGVRQGMALMIPVLLVGAAVISSAGRFMASDIHKVRVSAVAQADVQAARRRGEVKLLLVRGLDVAYDNVQVLFGVDFEVGEGEIVALLGTNGAGKSTLLKSISGLVDAQAGAIVFDGRDMTYTPPNEVAARGVLQVPGGRGIFPSLTVAENINLGGWLYRRDPAHVKAATERVLGYFPVLRERWDQKAGNLSGGEQQMLTLGMAFIAKPRLLMIDELSLGLAPVIVEQLLGIVRAIRDQGTTIILVEQSVNVALTVAHTAYFMEKGEIRFHGPTTELLERPDLLRSVFLEGAASAKRIAESTQLATVARGGHDLVKREFTAVCEHCGTVHRMVLDVAELSKGFGGIKAVDEVSFNVRRGEILGIIGPNGAGKTTVFDLVSGFLVADRGRILVDDVDVTTRGPDERARAGLGRSFQDARLFPSMTVEQTIAVALERHVATPDPLAAVLGSPATRMSERRVTERVEQLIELMGLDAFANKFVSELSTGTRRVVDLACTLAHEPKVILFDEPSSGIAQRETEALGPLLLDIRDKTGAALVVIEHDMPLVTTVSDRMIALELGRVIAEGTPADVVTHPQVVESYLGASAEAINRSGAAALKPSGGKARRRKASAPR